MTNNKTPNTAERSADVCRKDNKDLECVRNDYCNCGGIIKHETWCNRLKYKDNASQKCVDNTHSAFAKTDEQGKTGHDKSSLETPNKKTELSARTSPEFCLEKEIRELFEKELLGRLTNAGRIYRKIVAMDKEFIRRLKGSFEFKDNFRTLNNDRCLLITEQEFNKIIDTLVGEALTK